MNSLFESLPSEDGTPARDVASIGPCLVVCSIGYEGDVDRTVIKSLAGATGADLRVKVHLPGAPGLQGDGSDDRGTAYLTVPLVDGAANRQWTFHLYDRDEGSDDDLGTVSFEPRFPSAVKSASTRVACRAVPRDQVEARVREALPEVDQEIEKIAAEMTIETRDDTLGYDRTADSLREAISQVSGWVGWADPRVARRREWASRILDEFKKNRVAFIAEQARASQRRASFQFRWGLYSAEVTELSCEPDLVAGYMKRESIERAAQGKDLACVLRFALSNDGRETLTDDQGVKGYWGMRVARYDGETFPAYFLAFEGPGAVRDPESKDTVIHPKTNAVAVFGVPRGAHIAGDPNRRAALVYMNPSMSQSTTFLPVERGDR